jgi:hypothetical protein
MTRRAVRIARTTRVSLAVIALSSVLSRSSPAGAQSLQPPPPLEPAPQPGQPGPVPASLPSTPIMTVSPTRVYPRDQESRDSGLGLEWVWLNAEVGGAYVNMQSFNSSNLALQKTETGGPAFGVAAGVRLIFFTLGVRARDLQLASIGSLWELSGEAAFHTRIGHVDPYFGVRGGYNFVGSLSSDSVQVAAGSAPPDVSIHGFDVGPTVGFDVYLAHVVSIGVDVDGQFLFLQRPKAPLPAGVTEAMLPAQYRPLYDNSGSSVGFGVTGTAHLGIHF